MLSVITAAAVTALLGAVPAPTNPQPGTFVGRTAEGRGLLFKVSKAGVVTKIRFDVMLNCKDGSALDFALRWNNFATPISAGTFSRAVTDTSYQGFPYTATLSGSFSSRTRMTGYVSVGETRTDGSRGGACMTGTSSVQGAVPIAYRAHRKVQAVGR